MDDMSSWIPLHWEGRGHEYGHYALGLERDGFDICINTWRLWYGDVLLHFMDLHLYWLTLCVPLTFLCLSFVILERSLLSQ